MKKILFLIYIHTLLYSGVQGQQFLIDEVVDPYGSLKEEVKVNRHHFLASFQLDLLLPNEDGAMGEYKTGFFFGYNIGWKYYVTEAETHGPTVSIGLRFGTQRIASFGEQNNPFLGDTRSFQSISPNLVDEERLEYFSFGPQVGYVWHPFSSKKRWFVQPSAGLNFFRVTYSDIVDLQGSNLSETLERDFRNISGIRTMTVEYRLSVGWGPFSLYGSYLPHNIIRRPDIPRTSQIMIGLQIGSL